MSVEVIDEAEQLLPVFDDPNLVSCGALAPVASLAQRSRLSDLIAGTLTLGRLARSARRLVLHLPKHWPGQPAWKTLFATTCGPPGVATT